MLIIQSWRKILPAVFVLLFLFAGGGVLGQAISLEDSVVMIRGVSQSYDYKMPWKQQSMRQGVGTGFIIDGNRILTNAHNVSNNRYVDVKKKDIAQRFPARIEYIGHDCDLAILRIDTPGFFDGMAALPIGGLPKVNSTVNTYGYPVGGEHISITEGVVSRIQMDSYSHTGADEHLVVQTDAAINPGNSGGPVIQNGQVVGVAFQGLTQADNIGYMIPTTVIRHFLEDIEDGTYDGFGSLGLASFPGLHSESYKEYLKMPADKEGVVILRTLLNSSVEDVLQKNDVLTALDGYDIDKDGKVMIGGLRLKMAEVVERKQIGEKIRMTFYRQGRRMEKEVAVQLNRPVLDYSRAYDTPPEYVVYAGLVFTPVTRNFLETWGNSWPSEIPHHLKYLFRFSSQFNEYPEREEYVALAELLADEINRYHNGYQNLVVEEINGKTVHSVAELHNIIDSLDDEFIHIKFMGADQPLILNREDAMQRHEIILKAYNVPAEKRING